MSITNVFSDRGRQAVYIPDNCRFNTRNVIVERVGEGVLLKPVSKRDVSFEEIFKMMDDAQREEGPFELDRSDNQIPASKEIF